MVQSPGNGRQIFEAACDVARLFLQDDAALVLGESPPSLRLANGDERRLGSLRTRKPLLAGNKGVGILASALLGWLLLNAHERIGDLKAESAAKGAIIAMKEKDANLSAQLVEMQTGFTSALNNMVFPVREVIRNVPVNVACSNDPAFVAASDGVRLVREAKPGPRRPTP